MLWNFIYAVFFLILFILILCLITESSFPLSSSLKEGARGRGIPEYPSSWPPVPANKGSYASLGERYTVECAERLFGKTFTKCRPTFLRNDETGRNLELDGYCSEIGIALEYNGIQHYIWPNFTNCTFEEFEKQVERDSMKRRKCNENGICLLVIPYTVPLDQIPDYLYSKVVEASRENVYKNYPSY